MAPYAYNVFSRSTPESVSNDSIAVFIVYERLLSIVIWLISVPTGLKDRNLIKGSNQGTLLPMFHYYVANSFGCITNEMTKHFSSRGIINSSHYT